MKDIYSELGDVGKTVEDVVQKTDTYIAPVRNSFFRRFPTTVLLLVAFGASATVYGIERLIADITWLNDRPILIVGLGVLLLFITGRLYKKLG